MSANFNVAVEKKDKALEFRFSGRLNETVNLSGLLEQLRSLSTQYKEVEFNLKEIVQFNSVGIKQWIMFIRAVEPLVKYKFSVVGELFIEQAAIVPGVLGKPGIEIAAFEVPYICGKCKARVLKVLRPADIQASGGSYEAPKLSCDACKAPMTVDAIEDEYFAFLPSP